MQRVTIFTDGACRGNPGPGGWAAVLTFEGRQKTLCGSARHTTNNRMELMAAIEALNALKWRCAVELFTDSEYLQKGIRNWLPRWKTREFLTIASQPVKNQDLWQKLEQAASQHEVQCNWVRGHVGNKINELCDRLAKEALENGINPSESEANVQPIRKETRTITLTDGSSQVVDVEIYPAAWAKGASRQTIGRITRNRRLRGRMK